jgi:hypothetical protein
MVLSKNRCFPARVNLSFVDQLTSVTPNEDLRSLGKDVAKKSEEAHAAAAAVSRT